MLASFYASAQSYFHIDNGILEIHENFNGKVIHFSSNEDFELFERLLPINLQIVKKLSKYNALVVKANQALPDDIRTIEGLSEVNISHQTPVFAIDDGFELWLGYELLFVPKIGFDSEIQTLARQYNCQLKNDVYGTWIAKLDNPMATIAMSNELVESGYVEYAQPNFYANSSKQDDPLFEQQFQLNNTGQVANGASGLDDIDCNAPEAWEISTGNASIIVAVIDDGVEEHEDITNPNGTTRILPGFTPSTDGDGTPVGNFSHGMACAGIIAASHNDIGVKGVAPNVQILPINIFSGNETTADYVSAFNFARTSGADVISNSWNYNSCSFSSSALNFAINQARNDGRDGLGCVVVFSAGNGYGFCVDYPADLSYVMSVGAITNLGTHSNYSNEGPTLDIVAPSSAAGGQSGANVSTTDRPGSAGYSSGDYTNTFGGTSAACPVVSGVAALVLSVNPALTESEVRAIIESTATDMGTSGFDNTFGHGRINALDALIATPVGECISISAFVPFEENFEGDLSDWTQLESEELDWTQITGSTPSMNTGASGAFNGSQYLYIESSYPNYYNKTAKLESPCFDISALNFPELSIASHMFGAAMGTLKIEASIDDENWNTIYSLSGNQGDSWNEISVSLVEFLGQSHLRLRFTGITASNYTGDLCIDALFIGEGNQDNCENTITFVPYSESFESTDFDWSQSENDDINWTRKYGSTTSMSTGPYSANDGDFYMYVESSRPNYPGKTAILESDCIDISGTEGGVLRFDYHMYGIDIGDLKVRAKSGDDSWTPLWSMESNQGNEWFQANIELSSFNQPSDLVIQFLGTTGPGFRSDIAIDNVEIIDNPGIIDESSSQNISLNNLDKSRAELLVFPNPTNDLVSIQLSEEKSIQISIRSLTGQVLKEYSGNTSFVQFTLSDLANGIYLIDVRSGDEIIGIQKIAKTQ